MRAHTLIAVTLISMTAGCKAASSDDASKSSKSSKPSAMPAGPDTPNPGSDGAQGQGSGGQPGPLGSGGAAPAQPSGSAAGGASVEHGDAGDSMPDRDAGASEPDAAVNDGGGGAQALGSCCMAHDTPGCSNADLQVCVCEKISACCTEAWSEACVLIVQQKYCQPGVRDCVCGDGDGQWGQASCCSSDWSETFCDQVAETKCGAQPGCL